MTVPSLSFPLFDRAEKLGVLDGGSAVIVAPTATGKSFIGRQAICRALARRTTATHAYLVPYRALATEVFESFMDLLQGTDARVRITTGDYRDPIRPEEADLVVATYESFVALLRRTGFHPGVVVADEVHLLGDDHRGPVVEGLLARLRALHSPDSVVALSAVIENAEDIAKWLEIDLLAGSAEDRPVPLTLEDRVVDDIGTAFADLLAPCADGEQALVFCSSRQHAERTAEELAEAMRNSVQKDDREFLNDLAERLREDDSVVESVVDLLPSGVVYHHAGLPRRARREIETAFRDHRIRIITGTTTLAAGVNLPAGITVVRDIFRADVVRGVFRNTLIPSGEVLNMLGRAARPHQVQHGLGVAFVPKRHAREGQVKDLMARVRSGRGGAVTSRLTESFEAIMRFVLGVIVERGETTREDVFGAFSHTLAYQTSPVDLNEVRPFEEDMMEDLPAYQKVRDADGSIYTADYALSPEGVRANVASGTKRYEVVVGVTDVTCTCPAATRWYRGRICKHQACAIHDLLFGEETEQEIRWRAIYNCGHVFGPTLDLATRLNLALEILVGWGLAERVPAGWQATPVGRVASISRLDLLLVRQAVQRVVELRQATYDQFALCAVEDYFAEDKDREDWRRAVGQWLDEVDMKRMRLPTKYRGDFERRLEDLSLVCRLYGDAARALGKPELARIAEDAGRSLRYGVAPDLVPLAALGFRQLGRARCRHLYECGIRNVQDLANAAPADIADPRRAPQAYAREWIAQAKEIHQARSVARADREEADTEFDELVARFQLDPAALPA